MKRIALISGMFTLLVLDLLALEDITTTSDWRVETVFLLTSIPALLTFAHYLRRDRGGSQRNGQQTVPEAPQAGLLGRGWRSYMRGQREAEHSEIRS